MNKTNTVTIIPYDKKHRIHVFILYAIIIMGITLFLTLLLTPVKAFFNSLYPKELLLISERILILMLLVFILPSLFLIRIGKATLREHRYPYSTMRIMFNMPLIEGNSADRKGRFFLYLGYAGILFAVLGTIFTITAFYLFRHDPLFINLLL